MPSQRVRSTLILSLLLVSAGASAQVPTYNSEVRAAVLDSLATRLARLYVDADTAGMIADVLRRRLRAGGYDTLRTPARFAEVVTRDLRQINGDPHLSLQYAGVPLSNPGTQRPPSAMRQNFGLTQIQILPGNIGYLEISGFLQQAGYEDAVAQAMRTLQNTDAIIIDVRRNGGGGSGYSHLVFSYFLGADPVETIRVVNRGAGTSNIRKSIGEVAGPRRTDVPIYVLTSRGTASAAEEFAFVLKNQKRATIVGDRTAGAGHMVSHVPLGHGFTGGISITRVTDAATGLEWEGHGVKPDLAVAPENALDVAHADALKKVAARLTGLERRSLELLAEAVDARQQGLKGSDELSRFAGAYDEDRSVEYRAGKLWFRRRAAVMPDELIPLSNGAFANGSARVSFRDNGGKLVLTVEQPDGTTLSYAKR